MKQLGKWGCGRGGWKRRQVARKQSHAWHVFPAGNGEPMKDFEGGQMEPNAFCDHSLPGIQEETRNCSQDNKGLAESIGNAGRYRFETERKDILS